MKSFFVTLALLFSVSCGEGGCELFKETQVSKPKTYTETEGKTNPYYEVEKKPWVRSMGCSNTGCNYSVWVWVKLYNPTAKDILATTSCSFTMGENFTSGTAKREEIKVPAGKMVKAEVSHILGVSSEEPTYIGVDCAAVFYE